MDDDILKDYECGLETNIPWKIPHYGEHNITTKKRHNDSLIWNIEYKPSDCNYVTTRTSNANGNIVNSYIMKRKNTPKSINNLNYPYIKFVNYILEHGHNNSNHYSNDSVIYNENDANLEFNRMLKGNPNFTMNTKGKKNKASTSGDKPDYILQNQSNRIYKLDNIRKYKRNQSPIVYYDFNTNNCTISNFDNKRRSCPHNSTSNSRIIIPKNNNNPLSPIVYDRCENREAGKDKNGIVGANPVETELDLEQLLSCDTVDHLLSPDNCYNSNDELSYMSNSLSLTTENNNNSDNNNHGNNILISNNYTNINTINKEVSTTVDIAELLRDTEIYLS